MQYMNWLIYIFQVTEFLKIRRKRSTSLRKPHTPDMQMQHIMSDTAMITVSELNNPSKKLILGIGIQPITIPDSVNSKSVSCMRLEEV